MAITVTTPNELCFAGNPIIVKATTDKRLSEEESMLRIILYVTFKEKYNGGESREAYTFTTDLSQPVENAGTAVFNLSDAAMTVIQRLMSEMDMNSDSWNRQVGLSCEYSCRDIWVVDGYEQYGDSSGTFSFDVIPGAFTDFEMLSRGSIDLTEAFPAALSRMPAGRIIYKGDSLVVPAVSMESGEFDWSFSFESDPDVKITGSVLVEGRTVYYMVADVESGAEGGFQFAGNMSENITGHFRNNRNGVHSLRFINGFGAVESISVRSRDKLSYEVSGENHSLVQEIGVRPTDRRYSTKSQPVGVYELSSGYVPQRWAEWYVQELLTSPRVWIQLGGKWIPALIEASDECVIYDRSNPEMPHVDFTLRLAVDGVTGCVW